MMVGKVLQVFKTFKYGRLCAPAITKNKQNKNFEVSTMFHFGFNLQYFSHADLCSTGREYSGSVKGGLCQILE